MATPAVRSDLLLAARAGDGRALDALCTQWLPVVLRWCQRLGGRGVDADDAAADVFVRVLDRFDGIRNLNSFDAWIFGVTRRVLAAHRRRAWLRRWVPGVVADTNDSAAGPAERAEMSEISRQVQAALDLLPEEQREVLVLCDVEDRTDVEVAAMVDVPVGTVKSRLRLARARMRREAERLRLGPDQVPARLSLVRSEAGDGLD